jgi:hypothetical protein
MGQFEEGLKNTEKSSITVQDATITDKQFLESSALKMYQQFGTYS